MDRREFMQTATGAAMVVAADGANVLAQTPVKDERMIGIQIGAVSFLDEGVEAVLDRLQSVGVNTLLVATFTYGRGIAGRQLPGQPLPDHGAQKYDTDTFFGGSYTKVNPKYYQNTVFKSFRAPDLGDFDVLEAVVPSAKKRGMKVVCWYEDVFRRNLPNVDQMQELQLSGKKAVTCCFNNPNYHNWLQAIAEDWARTYDIDGIMWGSERQGAFADVIGAREYMPPTGEATCFCEFCIAKGKAQGINIERMRAGFVELQKYAEAARSPTAARPVDGYYVELWRLMLKYPELLQWERLWTTSLHDIQRDLYQHVKSITPKLGVGWHIWHNNTFSPIYRAEQDLAEMAPFSDFIKVVMYNNCAGEREAEYIKDVERSYFRDVPAQQLLDLHYKLMDFGNEATLAALPTTGLSADYVYRETKRSKAGVAGLQTKIWSGIDIDIPTRNGNSKCTPAGVKAAVQGALRGGADGILLSRKYSEMRLANLMAAGEAIKESRA